MEGRLYPAIFSSTDQRDSRSRDVTRKDVGYHAENALHFGRRLVSAHNWAAGVGLLSRSQYFCRPFARFGVEFCLGKRAHCDLETTKTKGSRRIPVEPPQALNGEAIDTFLRYL